MWKCFWTRRRLVDYQEGTLSFGQKKSVDEHLAVCPACRALWESWRVVEECRAQDSSPRMPESFWKEFDTELHRRILERLPVEEEPRRRVEPRLIFRMILRPALIVMPLAIIVLALSLRVLHYPQSDLGSKYASTLVSEAVLIDDLTAENVVLLQGEEDIVAEMETLYLLDPSFLQDIV